MALARDANDILGDDRIPAEERLQAGKPLAKALYVQDDPDPVNLGRAIAWKINEQGYALQARPGKALTDVIGDMVDLYAAAMATPTGPTYGKDGSRWQCLCPHDFAEVQRGLLLVSLLTQIRSMGYCLGVPQQTYELCEAVANGLGRLAGIDAYFRGSGLILIRRYDAAKEEARKFLNSTFGQSLWGRGMIVMAWSREATPDYGKGKHELWPGRGAWDWSTCSLGAMYDGSYASDILAWRTLSVDACNNRPLDVLLWNWKTVPDIAESFLARLPYNLHVLTEASAAAFNHDRPDRAIEIDRQIVDLMPRDSGGYARLANQYADVGKYDKAIEIVRQADKKCDFSIQLSNLLGQGACWLVRMKRPEEALQFGRKSTAATRYRGLQGLAVALAANHKDAEAEDVYRKLAFRYDNGTEEYIQFLLKHKKDPAYIAKEIRGLLAEYSQFKDSIAGYVGTACYSAAVDPQVLEGFYAGPLAFVAQNDRLVQLLGSAVYSRNFEKAVEYGLALHDAKHLTVYQRMWLLQAMQLTGRTARFKEVKARLPIYGDKIDIHAHVQYVLGKVTWQQLLDGTNSEYTRSLRLLATRHGGRGPARPAGSPQGLRDRCQIEHWGRCPMALLLLVPCD